MINVNIAKEYYYDGNGDFDKDKALILSGHFAGVCYDLEGYEHIKGEPIEDTRKRIKITKDNGHHSVYDHIFISFDITNVPKLLAMVLNNEHQYTTSEKSARYTPVIKKEGSPITDREAELYNKWLEIFKIKIKNRYGNVYPDGKITKLAQENARYLVTVFMPTTFVYTTSFRQINYIVTWFNKYIAEHDATKPFEHKLALAMADFISQIESLKVLDAGLLNEGKNRRISLFKDGLANKETIFSDVYQTVYEGSFAEYAQAQRHRTIFYNLELKNDKTYFIPPILEDEPLLVREWLDDIESVKEVNPQGEMVRIFERGIYENFILKCKERLCSAAQLEIMLQTKATLTDYYNELKSAGHELANDMEQYTHGARCTFPDFNCNKPCKFEEGIKLTRKI